METTLPKITSPVPSETRLFRAVVSHCASASQAEEVVASFAELSWQQLGGKLDSGAACRVPDNEGRYGGNDFARIRSATPSQYRPVAPCACRDDHAGHR